MGGEGARDSLVYVSKDKKMRVWNYQSGLCRATHSTEYKFSVLVGHGKLGTWWPGSTRGRCYSRC